MSVSRKRRDEWVRVKSEDELRVGMTVEMRPCSWCHRRERNVLLREYPRCPSECVDGTVVMSRTFAFSGGCSGKSHARSMGYLMAIANGLLFRLADSQTAEEATTREMERVR